MSSEEARERYRRARADHGLPPAVSRETVARVARLLGREEIPEESVGIAAVSA